MSSNPQEDHIGEVPSSQEAFERMDRGLPGGGEALTGESGAPAIGTAPIPTWLVGVIGLGFFWAGAYLFSFSGGFKPDVFDYEPKFGVVGGARVAADPKAVGKALFSANCITCHQANGQGIPGQYPPLVGSEIVLGPALNHTIAIVLKGLQGPVTVEGRPFNNSMQAWEDQYTDQQIASILTYERSDWGNNGAPVTADMVKQVRDEIKDRKEQWTWAELQKLPPKDLAAPAAGGSPPPGQPKPANPGQQNQSAPPAPTQPSTKG
jgi:mono/diheme cytochrome c family protein